ncbi:MAG: FAD-dependent oxidoreductase [Campylobacterota bacterium]
MNRRDAIKLGLASSTLALTNLHAGEKNKNLTQKVNKLGAKERVVIIGGGFAGLTTAKNIKIHNKDAEVLVFDPKNIFASCPYSNLWLTHNEGTSYDELTFSPLEPAGKYGYKVINKAVTDIDRENKTISTLDAQYEYTLLVLATGIEYDYAPYGVNEQQAQEIYTRFTPSYGGGYEQLTLHKKIQEFQQGTFVITVPPGSYRCPPAPYERAALLANYFKKNSLDARVVLLDPRVKPATKAKGFLQAFAKVQSHLRYEPSSNIDFIDAKNKRISYKQFDTNEKRFANKEIAFDDANIIAANKATPLLQQSALETTDGGWGRVKSPGFESLNDANIYLLGDVLGEYPFPKSGQMANSCGIIVGKQIARRLQGLDPKVGSDMPANVCYSFVEADKAIAVTHQAYLKNGQVAVEAELFENADTQTAQATKAWYKGITESIFE